MRTLGIEWIFSKMENLSGSDWNRIERVLGKSRPLEAVTVPELISWLPLLSLGLGPSPGQSAGGILGKASLPVRTQPSSLMVWLCPAVGKIPRLLAPPALIPAL